MEQKKSEFDKVLGGVISNNFYGMYTATRHLIKKGHKKIAYVGSVKSSNSIASISNNSILFPPFFKILHSQ